MKLKEKILVVHNVVVNGLLNPKLTHTSEQCDYELRSKLFSYANITIMAAVWELESQYEQNLNELKRFVKEVKNDNI